VIPAARSAWFGWWLARHAQRRIERRFARVLVRGRDTLVRAAGESPVLIVSNHTSWWDPLVIIHLLWRVVPLEAYAMMDARNLRLLPFFRHVGAFGVDLDDAADGARGIRYACKRLDRAGQAVWIFAQGREVPVTVRPLVFRRGAWQIARVARRAKVLPCALRYEMGSRADPVLYVSFGDEVEIPRHADRSARILENAVTSELDRIDAVIVSGETLEFETLHEKKDGALATWATQTLARLTRAAER
jgi:1-acyl-sn-glycerol-3-phosphate acyltransferase